MSQSCFTLGFLFQNSLYKLSFFCGYKGYLYWSEKRMRNVRFFKTGVAHGLASRLDWVARSSCAITERPIVLFCPVVFQLAWRFNFWHAWHVCCFWRLTALQPRVTRKIQSRVSIFLAQSWAFHHTISLTTFTKIPPKYRVTNCWNTSNFGME